MCQFQIAAGRPLSLVMAVRRLHPQRNERYSSLNGGKYEKRTRVRRCSLIFIMIIICVSPVVLDGVGACFVCNVVNLKREYPNTFTYMQYYSYTTSCVQASSIVGRSTNARAQA